MADDDDGDDYNTWGEALHDLGAFYHYQEPYELPAFEQIHIEAGVIRAINDDAGRWTTEMIQADTPNNIYNLVISADNSPSNIEAIDFLLDNLEPAIEEINEYLSQIRIRLRTVGVRVSKLNIFDITKQQVRAMSRRNGFEFWNDDEEFVDFINSAEWDRRIHKHVEIFYRQSNAADPFVLYDERVAQQEAMEDEEDARQFAQAQGIAYDVHARSASIDKKAFFQKLREIQGEYRYRPDMIIHYLTDSLHRIVDKNARFSAEERETLHNDIQVLITKLRTQPINELKAMRIGLSIDYVMAQDDVFKQLYVDAYVTDCIQAYPRREQGNTDTMSCARGIYERIYLYIYRAIEQRLLAADDFPLVEEKRAEYMRLVGSDILFTIDFILDKAREWKRGQIPASREGRIESLRTHIINRATESGITMGEKENAKIEEFLQGAFDEDGDLYFGGKKRRHTRNTHRKKRIQKKTHKRKGKSRKTKKIR